MPEGCSTWPAIWEVYPINWPSGGEFDIVEGVNNQPLNSATMHTSPGCKMPPSAGNPHRKQLGTDNYNNCDGLANGNAGCGVSFPKNGPPSFGPAFNKAGGGWYERDILCSRRFTHFIYALGSFSNGQRLTSVYGSGQGTIRTYHRKSNLLLAFLLTHPSMANPTRIFRTRAAISMSTSKRTTLSSI